MDKFHIAENYILSMYEYLFQYCCIPESLAHTVRNMTHKTVIKQLDNHIIFPFPMRYFQEIWERQSLLSLEVNKNYQKVLKREE